MGSQELVTNAGEDWAGIGGAARAGAGPAPYK